MCKQRGRGGFKIIVNVAHTLDSFLYSEFISLKLPDFSVDAVISPCFSLFSHGNYSHHDAEA